jgi:hypothetical protein
MLDGSAPTDRDDGMEPLAGLTISQAALVEAVNARERWKQ